MSATGRSIFLADFPFSPQEQIVKHFARIIALCSFRTSHQKTNSNQQTFEKLKPSRSTLSFSTECPQTGPTVSDTLASLSGKSGRLLLRTASSNTETKSDNALVLFHKNDRTKQFWGTTKEPIRSLTLLALLHCTYNVHFFILFFSMDSLEVNEQTQ